MTKKLKKWKITIEIEKKSDSSPQKIHLRHKSLKLREHFNEYFLVYNCIDPGATNPDYNSWMHVI